MSRAPLRYSLTFIFVFWRQANLELLYACHKVEEFGWVSNNSFMRNLEYCFMYAGSKTNLGA